MVSIVITAYNVDKYIEQSIRSAMEQTYNDLEIVVVLDKPTDRTEEIVRRIASEDSRIKIVENETNVGAGLSRRYGIAASTGDYILLLDGDDWLNPDFIEVLYKSAVETGADITSGGVVHRYSDGYYETQCCGETVSEGYDKVVKFWGLKTVFMNNRLIKRHLFEKVIYSHRRYIEDTPVIIPMLWYANKVVYKDNCGYNYRVNDDSLTHTSNPFKEFLFKGLCWCDLIEFFNEKDPGLYQHLDIRTYVRTIFTQINNARFTPEMIAEYPEEWAEFWARLFNLVSVNGIDFKNGNVSGQIPTDQDIAATARANAARMQ